MLNRTGASVDLWTPTRFGTSDHHPLGSASFQPTSLSAHHHAWRHQQLVYKDLMGDGVKGPTQVQADNIHCSSLIYQGSFMTTQFIQMNTKGLKDSLTLRVVVKIHWYVQVPVTMLIKLPCYKRLHWRTQIQRKLRNTVASVQCKP